MHRPLALSHHVLSLDPSFPPTKRDQHVLGNIVQHGSSLRESNVVSQSTCRTWGGDGDEDALCAFGYGGHKDKDD